MNAFGKFNLIEDHGLRDDQPNCETNDQCAKREWSTAVDSLCNNAARCIANFENAILSCAVKLQSLISSVDRVVCRILHAQRLRVAGILIRVHALKLVLVEEHGYFALARFSVAPPEVVYSPSFVIPSKFFCARAWVH